MGPVPVTGDFLAPIVARKRREIARRIAHRALAPTLDVGAGPRREAMAVAALRRGGSALPRVIAEIKLRSPSAGLLRERTPGLVRALARAYVEGGASAVSVLCDGPGFGGTPLDVRRAAETVAVPVLFKEFVLDPAQIDLARALGAHLVLLVVRAIGGAAVADLVRETRRRGLAPLVEVADRAELEVALGTDASLIGVNARDLRTFRVDPHAAKEIVAAIPRDRVAVYMSGVAGPEDLAEVGRGRADAVLIGETLMRAPDPAARLRELLASSHR